MKIKHLPKFIALAMAVTLSLPASQALSGSMGTTNEFWWPEKLQLDQLRAHDARSNPYRDDFDYAQAFASVDLIELKKDIEQTLTTSQDWWPADWGHYGGLMIRSAWHAAGTYRVLDGRGGADGGQTRLEPQNSWPDNANLDKARRILWPVKQKYGRSVSWGDLIILAGNVALESMGFETLGFAGGRADEWESDLVYWGNEKKWLDHKERYKDGSLQSPLAAVQMGLIYVNPEGPGGNNDPLSAAQDMRLSFGRMAMNDEEIVALVAGGHTLGKAHGAKKGDCVGPEPAAAAVEEQGFGWKNKCGKGNAEDTMTSGLEGAWTSTPTAWSILYLDNLFRFEWKMTKSPAGATQWIPTDEAAGSLLIPDAHIEGKRHAPIMFTTDMALKKDPGFREISERFLKNPKEFDRAFASAWFKLTHRDMGPRSRYVGSEVPAETFVWQDPVPAVDHKLIGTNDADKLKEKILKSGLTVSQLVRTAWASASSYRDSDMRGGANGARIRLAPQKDWAANDPADLAKVLDVLEDIQQTFNKKSGKNKVSFADVIVLGGAAAVEEAAKNAGISLDIPFTPGRTDASQEQTDVKSFGYLEPTADAFRNYYRASFGNPAEMLVEKADLLSLTAPEMTVLVGGMRALGANAGDSKHGILTDKPGTLSNDFFINLLDMSTVWSKSDTDGVYNGVDRVSGKQKYTATSVDLVFGSNSELRAITEVYASDNSKEKFVKDFAQAWSKVMRLDRFDLK